MSRSVRNAGRVSLLGLIAGVAVSLIGTGFFYAQQSVATVGSQFMDALARGDVNTLTEMSYMADLPKEEIRKRWDFAVNKAGPYYRFAWAISASGETADNTGYVRLKVTRNAANAGGYDEPFQLPLVKVNGKWKVGVRSISRDMYPGLPR